MSIECSEGKSFHRKKERAWENKQHKNIQKTSGGQDAHKRFKDCLVCLSFCVSFEPATHLECFNQKLLSGILEDHRRYGRVDIVGYINTDFNRVVAEKAGNLLLWNDLQEFRKFEIIKPVNDVASSVQVVETSQLKMNWAARTSLFHGSHTDFIKSIL